MPTLAVSMIVRNAEADLAACLESVRGVAGEIIVADTGATDGTIRIAEECAARVLRIPWEMDFSSARNQCLAAVSSDWVLSLDADEVLDPEAGQILPRLLADAGTAAYQVTIRNYLLSITE